MRFIARAQVLYWGRVESPAIPELRDQDPFMLMDLNRGLQHGSPVQKEEEIEVFEFLRADSIRTLRKDL
jgi:hypothetical protein